MTELANRVTVLSDAATQLARAVFETASPVIELPDAVTQIAI